MTVNPQSTPLSASYPANPKQDQRQPAKHPNQDIEIMRDTAWRYGGFADEAGEILKPYLGEIGRRAGYGISGLYCLADLVLTARQMNKKGEHLPPWERRKKVAAELLDLSVFHTFATMLIPPFLIGKGVSWAQKHLSPEHPEQYNRTTALLRQGIGPWLGNRNIDEIIKKRLHKPIPTLVGLALIPIVAHPFDLLMEKIQDWTTRLLFKKHKLVQQPGAIIVQPQNHGKPKITQLPDHWRSVPRNDYWLPTDPSGKPASNVENPVYHTSAHRRHKQQPQPVQRVHQPQHFKSVFGEW